MTLFMKDSDKHNAHLMEVMDNMIKDLTGAYTFPHSNTIQIEGNGLREVLPTIVAQVPVLNMKVYRVNPNNLKENKDVDVHMLMFTSIFLDHCGRMRIGPDGKRISE